MKKKVKKYLGKLWREWRWTVFLIVFVVIPVKSSLADWNWVPTGSMKPTILEGDLIFVNKAAYGLRIPLTMWRVARWSGPEQGDIVICFSPEDGTRLVKRVIGEPGDTVEMRGGRVLLNGSAIEYRVLEARFTAYLSEELRGKCEFATEKLDGCEHAVMGVPGILAIRDFGPVEVGEGEYFVMGDNRDMSRDSRIFGFVKRERIVGKAKGIIVSFDKTDKYQPRLRRFLSSLR